MLDARAFLESSPLGRVLPADERRDLLALALERRYERGEHLALAGEPATHWTCIVEGLVSLSVSHADGEQTMLSAIGDGAWFGEGTLMKDEAWQYDAIALRRTRAVLVPKALFQRLRAGSLPFNHFLQELLNARLGSFIGAAISARRASIESRVARAIVDLSACPGASAGSVVRVSQGEIARLAGTSRQRANVALKRLGDLGLVEVVRDGLAVSDLRGLQALSASDAPMPADQPA